MRRFRIGTAFGIPLQIDLTFLLVLPLFAFLIGSQIEDTVLLFDRLFDAGIPVDALLGPVLPWAIGFVAALGLFVGVLAHELGHSLVAMRYGYGINSITLWIFGGLAALAEMPEDWREELAIATAGPIVSVLVGIACYGLYTIVPETLYEARYLALYLAVLNVALAAFNTIPAFPMDGGRMLRALLGRRYSFARATAIAAEVGKFFALVLGLLGIVQLNVILVGVAFFVYVAASGEARQVLTKAALEDVDVADVMTPADRLGTVSPATTVTELLDRMFEERSTGYPVVEDGRAVGIVTLDDARQVGELERDAYLVEDVMAANLATVEPDEGAMEALTAMREQGVGRLPVVDEGKLVGLISRTDLVAAMDGSGVGGNVGRHDLSA